MGVVLSARRHGVNVCVNPVLIEDFSRHTNKLEIRPGRGMCRFQQIDRFTCISDSGLRTCRQQLLSTLPHAVDVTRKLRSVSNLA